MSLRVARPYAAALGKALDRERTEVLRQVEGELAHVAQLFTSLPELLRAFEVPTVPWPRKQGVLQELGARLRLRPQVQRLLAALALHYRLRYLPEVVTVFRGLVDRREGVVRGTVTLPAPPRPGQLEALAEALRGVVEGRLHLEARVDPDMLAGFVVHVGSRVLDGSLRKQLERFTAAAAPAHS